MAASLACGPGALVAARDAAAVHDLRACNRSVVEVLVDCGGRRRRDGIQIHRGSIHREDRGVVAGIPVTSVARTLLDLAAVVDAKHVQRVFERAERLRVLDIAAIQRVLDRNNGHRGTGVLAALLEYDPVPAAQALSEPERMFLDLVRAAGLPAPQVNVLVEGYLVDAYWPAYGLVVEVQTHVYHSDRATFQRDHEKLADIKRTGLELLPVTDVQVKNDPAGLAALLAQLLAARGWRPGPASA